MPSADLTDAELYALVRHAVRDAVWDVLGTVAMLCFALLIAAVGLGALISAQRAGSAVFAAVGLGVLGVAVAVGYRELVRVA